MRIVDFFCGAGGASCGLQHSDFATVVAAVNHDPDAIAAHSANHPHTRHYNADITRLDAEELARNHPRVDAFWWSAECFPAGRLILSERGLVPIEGIKVGDRVLTHRGRYRAVTATMSKTADTIVVKGGGQPGLETTREHPFYTLHRPRVWHNDQRAYRRVNGEVGWRKAGSLDRDDYLAVPVEHPDLPVPEITGRPIEMNEAFWWLVGRWLGDGTLRYNEPITSAAPPKATRLSSQPAGSSCVVCGKPAKPDKRSKTGRVSAYCSYYCQRKTSDQRRGSVRGQGRVFITCGKHESDVLKPLLEQVEGLGPWSLRDMRTAHLYGVHHMGLARWLADNFGTHADCKTIPAWALGMPESHRQALLDGYISADGHDTKLMTTATSVSRDLMVGMRLLAGTLGHSVTLRVNTSREQGVIEGRVVTMRPLYSIAWTREPDPNRQPQTIVEGGHRWFKVRGVEHGNTNIRVYNISVEEDESYVVDGLVVHNCTHLSTAKGGQPRDADSRMLNFELPRYARVLKPKYVFIENVPDVLSWGPLRDGRVDPDRKGELHALWIRAMAKLGYRYDYRILNSADYGAHTSRNRYYGVFALDDAPIRWPEPTYRDPREPIGFLNASLEPWRTAREILDLDDHGRSIFGRKKPLADATIARIAVGINRYAPAREQAELHQMILKYYGSGITKPISEPLDTITTKDRFALVTTQFVKKYYGGTEHCRPLDEPLPTITTIPHEALVTAGILESGIRDIKLRMLSVPELKRAQGFPNHYVLPASQTLAKKFIGNSVVPVMAEALVRAQASRVEGWQVPVTTRLGTRAAAA